MAVLIDFIAELPDSDGMRESAVMMKVEKLRRVRILSRVMMFHMSCCTSGRS